MALTPRKGRNYRRKHLANSSSEDSDQEFRHPPTSTPLRIAIGVPAHLNSSTSDLGEGKLSSSKPEIVVGDGGEGKAKEAAGGGRSRHDGEQGTEQADEEMARSFVGPPSGGVGSGGLLNRKETLQTGAKRIRSGIGYNILKSMGWREDTGLGQSSNGIIDPILPTLKPNHLGLGFNPTAAHDAAQEEIRKIQKAKREERDKKLQQKLEKAEAAEEEAIFMRESSLAEPSSSYGHLFEIDSGVQLASSLPQRSKPSDSAQGKNLLEPGQCSHCKQRFDTKQALKSHVKARHVRLQSSVNRQLKDERRNGGRRRHGANRSRRSGGRQSARSLAPLSQDFSVYD